MKWQLTVLIWLAFNAILCAQTRPKTRITPKPALQKRTTESAERVAARTRARLDSIQKVNALAREMARQMFVEDSIQRARQLMVQQAETKQQASQTRPTTQTQSTATYKPHRSHTGTVAQPGILLGVRGSFLLSKLDVLGGKDELGEPSYRMAAGGALLVSIPIGKSPFALQLEPGYAERGSLFTAKGLMNNGVDRYEDKTAAKFQWLETPVLLRFTPSVGPLNIVLTAGAEARYLLSGTVVEQSAEYNIRTGAQVHSKTEVSSIALDRINRLDVGLVGGLGVSLPLAFGQVFLDGRYHHGLMDLDKNNTTQAYQHGFSANLGVLFSLH